MRNSLSLILIALLLNLGCVAPHRKTDCNDEAARMFSFLYSGVATVNQLTLEETGTPDFTEEEAISIALTPVILTYISCLDSAVTDHADPNVPLQPLWEHLEFKL